MISNIGTNAVISSAMMLAGKSTNQIADKVFSKLDVNGDGSIGKDEMQNALGTLAGAMGSSINVDNLFTKLDTDGDGKISKAENSAALQSLSDELAGHLRKMHGHHRAKKAGSPDELFQEADTNNDGNIDKNEFSSFLNTFSNGGGTGVNVNSTNSSNILSASNSLNPAFMAFAIRQYQANQAGGVSAA